MAEIFRSTILARALRPLPLAFALGWATFGGFTGAMLRSHPALDPVTAMYVLVAFMGLIGLDVENGGLHLILTRRITRNQYLAGRLLAAFCLCFVFCLFRFAVTCGITAWAGPGRFPPTSELLAVLIAWLGASAWQLGVLFFCSTFLPGRLDSFVYWLLLVANALVAGLGEMLDKPWLTALTDWIGDQLLNPLEIWAFDATTGWGLVRFASNLTVVVLAGVLIFHRRQFSYAAG